MKSRLFLLLAVATLIFSTSLPVLAAQQSEIQDSNQVLRDFTSQSTSNDSNRRIPESILRNAKGIVVLTNVTRGGFLFMGGRRGDGVMITRTSSGAWSNPVFVNLTGGSLGPQIGGSSSDLILVLMDQESVNRILRDRLEMGGDVAVAAGPVGGQVVSPVADPNPNVYSYSRSKGLFAGVSFSGAKIAFDNDKTSKYYGRETITPEQVFSGNNLTIPEEANALRTTLDTYNSGSLAAQPLTPRVDPLPAMPTEPISPMPPSSVPPSSVPPSTRILW